MTSSNEIIVIIPAFNEAETIGEVVKGVKMYADEVIVVDDGSSDGTGAEAKKAGVVVISHSKNRGYEASIEDGFKEAVKRGAFVLVTFDADGQHKPEDIKKLTDAILRDGTDVAIGQRSHVTHITEKIFAWHTNLKFGIKDPLCGLKAYTRNVYESIGHFDTLKSIGTQLILEAAGKGYNIKTVPIEINPRQDTSRFYANKVKGNYKICKAMCKIVWKTATKK